jgi:hypothetical protein
MPDVRSVEAKGDKAAILVMDDGSRIWTPEKDKADALVGKPIPSDWTRKEGDYGPQAFPPRVQKFGGGGGAAAFRNTKEGQAIEQDAMNRRTALMQAVEVDKNIRVHTGTATGPVLKYADELYAWLSKTPTNGGPQSGEKPATDRAHTAAVGGPTSEGVGAVPGEEAVAAPSADCVHPEAQRTTTSSGSIRCKLCGKKVS